MLDVHPPHHSVHGWRDFFIHIITITVGLLIAIGLEQSVEWFHHRHLVREARENIRHELESNRNEVQKDLRYVETDSRNMDANLRKARQFRDQPASIQKNEMHFEFTWSSPSDTAWRSARDTGALAYMPLTEVEGYSDVYGQQEIVNREAVDLFTHQSELIVPLLLEDNKSNLRPAEAQDLLEQCARATVRLNTLHQFLEGLDRQYAAALR